MKNININLDKERNLKFNLNTMAKYEEISGKSSFNISEEMNANTIRALLWACLIHEDKALTIDDVGNMIDLQNMSYVSEKLNELIKENTPKNNSIPNEQSQN